MRRRRRRRSSADGARGDVGAQDVELPRAGPVACSHQVEQAALAAAGRTGDDGQRPSAEHQVEAAQGIGLAGRRPVELHQPVAADRPRVIRRHGAPPRAPWWRLVAGRRRPPRPTSSTPTASSTAASTGAGAGRVSGGRSAAGSTVVGAIASAATANRGGHQRCGDDGDHLPGARPGEVGRPEAHPAQDDVGHRVAVGEADSEGQGGRRRRAAGRRRRGRRRSPDDQPAACSSGRVAADVRTSEACGRMSARSRVVATAAGERIDHTQVDMPPAPSVGLACAGGRPAWAPTSTGSARRRRCAMSPASASEPGKASTTPATTNGTYHSSYDTMCPGPRPRMSVSPTISTGSSLAPRSRELRQQLTAGVQLP